MRFSYLEHIAQEILPTIEIIWEVSRAFHSDSDQYVADYYQSIRHLAEDLDELEGVENYKD